LRRRPEDIPGLARHFLTLACRRLKRREPALSLADIQQLQRYPWPGNVRELENLLERAAIISTGARLHLEMPSAPVMAHEPPPSRPGLRILTQSEQRDLERDNLIAALQACQGKIAGVGGAAELLNLRPTTLRSRLDAFGLRPAAFKDKC